MNTEKFFTEWQQRILANAIVALAIVFLGALVVGSLLAVVALMEKLQWVLIPVAIGALIAYLLKPIVDWLHVKRRWSRAVAVVMVFTLGSVLVLGGFAWILPKMVDQLTGFAQETGKYLSQTTVKVNAAIEHARSTETATDWNRFVKKLTESVGAALPDLAKMFTENVLALLSNAFGLLGAVVGFLIIPIYVYYFLKDHDFFKEIWKYYLPVTHSGLRQDIISLVQEINESVKAFFRGQCIVAACVGALASLGFGLVGVNFALLLGVWVGVFDLVPFFGVVAGAIASAMIAIQQGGGMPLAIKAIAVCIGVHLIENWFLAPKIVGKKTGLHPVTILLSILIWGRLLGFVGVLLAVPLTSTLKVLFQHYVWRRLPVKS